MNCISLPDFQIMCKQLVSPMGIIQYIEWRERFYKESSYPIVVFLAHFGLEEIRCFVERVRKGLKTSKKKKFSIVGTMRNTIRNYGIIFVATEPRDIISLEEAIEMRYDISPVRERLIVAMSWASKTEYRIDFNYKTEKRL